MIVYKILKNADCYKVLKDGLPNFSAQRKSRLLGDKIIFYDKTGIEVITSKHRHFLFVGFGHKIDFKKTNYISYLSTKNGVSTLEYENKTYQIHYSSLGVKEDLIVNGHAEGTYKILNTQLSRFEHEIACNSETACLIFTIMDIVLDWFDVN